MINIFQPTLQHEELEAIKKVFESNWVGKGNITDQFESNFASYIGVNRNLVRSINCCTEGLFQSMNLLNIEPGDEVILPSISFVGAANAIASKKAKPVFCDIDKKTINATVSSIEEKITARTKAVILLHYGGLPCEMDEICQLLHDRGIYLIEDSACSVASRYKGQACGTFGDLGIWSFDAMKILVTGDGGMIYCKNSSLAQQAEELLYLGLSTKSGLSNKSDTRWWEFEVSCYGRRAIMNDISSAIGIEQLKKLNDFINRRKSNYDYYDHVFTDFHWLTKPQKIPPYAESSYYLYWIQTQPNL
jgi:aminotransferase